MPLGIVAIFVLLLSLLARGGTAWTVFLMSVQGVGITKANHWSDLLPQFKIATTKQPVPSNGHRKIIASKKYTAVRLAGL